MKKLFLAIVILASIVVWQSAEASIYLGIKKASETVAVPIILPLDSAGIPGTPDSFQVVTYADNGTAAAYTATGLVPDGSVIDTQTVGGLKRYWFIDQIQDIDGAGGNFELSIEVVAFYKKLPLQTIATVQVLSDSLENLLTSAADSSKSAAVLAKNGLDSLQAQDGWGAKEASVQIVRDTQNVRTTRLDSLLASAANTAKVGTGQIWNLRGLHIRGTTAGDTAIIADANNGNSDRGFFIRGGNAALQCKATGTILGVGILAQGGDDSVGIGMQLEAGGSLGDGLLANGYGANYAGIRCGTTPASGAVSFMADDGIWAPSITGNIVGRVDSIGAGGVNAVVNNAKITAIIDTVNGIIDTLQLYDGRTIASVDSVRHVAEVDTLLSGVAATATVDYKAFWDMPFDTSFTAGSMGDSLTNGSYVQGAASGLDSSIVTGAAKAALQAGIDASFGKIHATNFIVVDAADDDTGGVYIHSPLDDGIDINSDSMRAIRADAYGSRPTAGIYAHGSGDGIRSEIVTGATGSGASLNLLNSAGQTTTGYSLRATSNAGSYTVYISNTANALLSGAWWMGAEGDSASTLTLTQGSNDANVKTVQVEGTTSLYSKYSLAQSAVLIHGVKPGEPALYIYADSSAAIRASTSNPTYYDTAILVGGNISLGGNKFVGNITGNITGHVDTVNVVDTVLKGISTTLSESGLGTHVVTLYLVDTSGTDAAVSGATMTINDMSGTLHSYQATKSGGYIKFNATPTDTFLVSAELPGYVLPSADTVIVTGTVTDTVFGYNIAINPPAAASACRLYDYIYTTQLGAVEGATIVASLTGKNLRDSCLNVNIATPSAAVTTSDSTGYWYLDLAKSYCYDVTDSVFYQVTIIYPNGASPMTSKKVYITDSATQRMAW